MHQPAVILADGLGDCFHELGHQGPRRFRRVEAHYVCGRFTLVILRQMRADAGEAMIPAPQPTKIIVRDVGYGKYFWYQRRRRSVRKCTKHARKTSAYRPEGVPRFGAGFRCRMVN